MKKLMEDNLIKNFQLPLARAERMEKSEENKKLTIYESGSILGITLGLSNKDEVAILIKGLTTTDLKAQKNNRMFIFEDLNMSILFNEDDIAEEFNFGRHFKGKTSLGIGIGDTLNDAIFTYGKPKLSTIKGAIWSNIAFYCKDDQIISSIKLKSNF